MAENNRAYAHTFIRGETSVLLLENTSGPSPLSEFLRQSGIKNLDIHQNTGALTDLAALQRYDAVVLNNFPAREFIGGETGQMQLLHDYVQAHGGGVVMIGGENSFGVGGYYQTPIEKLLPVSMDITKKKHKALMTLIIVIDQSGSMSMTVPSGRTKIEIANEAAARTVQLLSEYDQVGILYVDTNPKWAVPVQPAKDKNKICEAIRSNRGGGGGIYVYSGLVAAYRAMEKATTPIKHIILFADAADSEQKEGCFPLAKDNLKNRVTLTVIGMGTINDCDASFLNKLAREGEGRFYLTPDLADLARIFTEDTMIASRRAINEKPFIPKQVGAASFTEGIDWSKTPTLYGYVTTAMKNRGEELLRGLEDDPLLAKWQYGLGRSVAFTSDAGHRWAKDWVNWEGSRKLWTQLLRWVSRKQEDNHYPTQILFEEGQGRLLLDAISLDGKTSAGLTGLTLRAFISNPEQKTTEVTLAPRGSGRYEIEFPASASGVYFATVVDENNNIVAQVGNALSYPLEYKVAPVKSYFLQDIAETGNGQVIRPDSNIFQHTAKPVRVPQGIWQTLILISLLLLVAEIAVRRLVIPETVPAWVRKQLRRKKIAVQTTPVQSSPWLERLKKVKTETVKFYEYRTPERKEIPKETEFIKVRKPEVAQPEPTTDKESEKPAAGTASYLSQLAKRKRKEKK
ncbi:MAG: glutamine amidotransferase [Planctomycetota bacterium]